MGLFAGFNLVAFVLVFLLVEETKRRSLEELDLIFAVRKRKFMRYQVFQYLPWFWRRYFQRKKGEEKPSLYIDMIWGSISDPSKPAGEDTKVAHPPGNEPAGLVEHTEQRREADAESIDSLHA